MTRIVALAMEKGGVAKTTSAVNIAAALAMKGKRVLLVDSDPQANATAACFKAEYSSDLYSVYGDPERTMDALYATPYGFYLMPATRDLSGVEFDTDTRHNTSDSLLLTKTLEPVFGLYDFIIIDLPPNLGALTINGLAAATDVLIPLHPEIHAVDGLDSLFETISMVRVLNPSLDVKGIFLTMVERNSLHRDIEREARQELAELGITVFRTKIKRTVRFGQAADRAEPAVLAYKKHPAVQAYIDLVGEAFGV